MNVRYLIEANVEKCYQLLPPNGPGNKALASCALENQPNRRERQHPISSGSGLGPFREDCGLPRSK